MQKNSGKDVNKPSETFRIPTTLEILMMLTMPTTRRVEQPEVHSAFWQSEHALSLKKGQLRLVEQAFLRRREHRPESELNQNSNACTYH